ncbi:hypothetical protein FOXB_04831 [Fusarium oxysporum f. sp. conglutinans Fo5176]|uniref:Uncharacterized protein n=1 Tax=Fusarium oxysporum (strain Fo5176) TaxID=660025 RepID=F9FEK3_FUSOF|nr:hypothetical protein FOXB_04831 [Fusarium oxysporum f. sp. conglutinans Fo5176]
MRNETRSYEVSRIYQMSYQAVILSLDIATKTWSTSNMTTVLQARHKNLG